MLPFSLPALELLKNAIGKAGYTDKVVIGMDVAASEFFRSGKYDLDFKSPDDPSRYITPDQLADLYKSFIKDYPGECFRAGAAALGVLRGLSRPGAHSYVRGLARCCRGVGEDPQCQLAVTPCGCLLSLSLQPPQQTRLFLLLEQEESRLCHAE